MLLTKKRGKLIPCTPHLLGTPGSWHSTSDVSFLAFLLDHSVPQVTNSELSWVLCVGVWKEGITCRLRASQLGWDLEPGKKSMLFLSKKKKKNYNSFYWAPTCARHFTYICAYNSHNNLGGRHYYHHFIDEELRLREVKQLTQGHAVSRWVVESGVNAPKVSLAFFTKKIEGVVEWAKRYIL